MAVEPATNADPQAAIAPSYRSDECGMAKLPPGALELMADFFKVLSEASRLQILCCLKSRAKNVTELGDRPFSTERSPIWYL